jgi:hypothetical protein
VPNSLQPRLDPDRNELKMSQKRLRNGWKTAMERLRNGWTVVFHQPRMLGNGLDHGVGLGVKTRSRPGTRCSAGNAFPADPADPFFVRQSTLDTAMVTFHGTRCSFPGRVWRSARGRYWNMIFVPNNGPPPNH